MKKIHRKITVDGFEYTWMAGKPNCDGDGGNLLSIYFFKVEKYSEVLNGNITITPKLVEQKIRENILNK